ncbi:MAG: HAMP domain-containing histidine kinase [Bacteroidetes bacterium]|nr:HAMP domain-containing histidine kinase [Bacteroidota bacterium]
MLIRHKIIVWFISLSGLLLCLFSVYIYLASANSRRASFMDRIRKKAQDTKEIYNLHDKIAERIITSIPEQSEYVFDENNKLIFAINDLHDVDFNAAFFNKVRKNQEYEFNYQQELKEGYKEGYAFVFNQGDKKCIIVITAYNKNGFIELRNLISILVVGNLFFLVVIGLSAYILSANAFRPMKDLVRQSESVQGHELDFRLSYTNPNDEIGIVASSFNKVLDKIQALAESQRSFISYASHELRTPLAAVHGILETSLTYDKDEAALRESLSAARKEIQKATGLVNGLLQLAKIESVNTTLEKSQLNVVDVLLDAISFFKLKIPDQEFLFDIPVMLSNEVYLEVNGNAHLLRTALINLIDNASKYSRQQKIEIKLETDQHGQIKIKIIDRGIGMASEDWHPLTEPFSRGKNATGFEGFGLGLSLTQRILTLHEGALYLTRNEYGGVTAEVTLPPSSGLSAE